MAAQPTIGDRSYGIIPLRIIPGTSTAQTTRARPNKANSQVLLIHQKTILGPPTHPKFWCFPKGHQEPSDASTQATAIRELYEETGLVVTEEDVILGNGAEFREVYVNPVRKVGKEVRYWVAVVRDGEKEVKIQEKEIAAARWCAWDEALKLVTFEETREMFKSVVEMLGAESATTGRL